MRKATLVIERSEPEQLREDLAESERVKRKFEEIEEVKRRLLKPQVEYVEHI